MKSKTKKALFEQIHVRVDRAFISLFTMTKQLNWLLDVQVPGRVGWIVWDQRSLSQSAQPELFETFKFLMQTAWGKQRLKKMFSFSIYTYFILNAFDTNTQQTIKQKTTIKKHTNKIHKGGWQPEYQSQCKIRVQFIFGIQHSSKT